MTEAKSTGKLLYGKLPRPSGKQGAPTVQEYFVALYATANHGIFTLPVFKEAGVPLSRIAEVFGVETADAVREDRGRRMSIDYPDNYRVLDYAGALLETSSDKLLRTPLLRTRVECNTLDFYVERDAREKRVVIRHHTDFSGTVLEADFPNGQTSTAIGRYAPETPDEDAVNAAGRAYLKGWGALPKEYPPRSTLIPHGYLLRTYEGEALADRLVDYHTLEAALTEFESVGNHRFPRIVHEGRTLVDRDFTTGEFIFWNFGAEAVYIEMLQRRAEAAEEVKGVPDADVARGRQATDDERLDDFIAHERWHEIADAASMESLLIRALNRFRTLDTKPLDELSPIQARAFDVLHAQFVGDLPDLRMFFTECDDFWDLPKHQRRQYLDLADALQNSGKDQRKYEAAMKVSEQIHAKKDDAALTPEQAQALAKFRDDHGRYWKRDLWEHWATGDYRGVEGAGLLQQVRNTLGPKWLRRVSVAELQAAANAALPRDARPLLHRHGHAASFSELRHGERFFDPVSGEDWIKASDTRARLAQPSDPSNERETDAFEPGDQVLTVIPELTLTLSPAEDQELLQIAQERHYAMVLRNALQPDHESPAASGEGIERVYSIRLVDALRVRQAVSEEHVGLRDLSDGLHRQVGQLLQRVARENCYVVSIYSERDGAKKVELDHAWWSDKELLEIGRDAYGITRPSTLDLSQPYVWFVSEGERDRAAPAGDFVLHIHHVNGQEPEASDYERIARRLGTEFHKQLVATTGSAQPTVVL